MIYSKLLLIIPVVFPLYINCAAISGTFSKLNTHSSGFSAYPTQNNQFHPTFDYKSYDYMKNEILKDTSVFHSWLTKGPLYSRKEADSLVEKLPPGGAIEFIDYENRFTPNINNYDDNFVFDSIKVLSLPDSIPLKVTSRDKREVLSWSTQITQYKKSTFVLIIDHIKDSALILINRDVTTGTIKSLKTINSWIIASKLQDSK